MVWWCGGVVGGWWLKFVFDDDVDDIGFRDDKVRNQE
jgi:hypothetical protein